MVDKAWEFCRAARDDIARAVELAPDDKLVLHAERALRRSEAILQKYTQQYKKDQKTLYKDKIMGPLDRKNREKTAAMRRKAGAQEQAEDFCGMPGLADD